MRVVLLCAALLACGASCREAVAPWTPDEAPADTAGALRLTWSTGNDLHPRWTPDEDAVIYAGDGFPGVTPAPGLLLRIPRFGGAASLLIPVLQSSAAIAGRFAQPALAPVGDRIAFFELARFRPPAVVLNPDDCRVPEPLLDSAVLRIRSPVAEASFEAAFPLLLAGPDPAQRAGLPGPYEVRLHAFQAAMGESGDLLPRPDWSPDGEKLVFSDGLRLYMWRPGENSPTPVPGTEGGVSPAWSPDGGRIAFTRLIRSDSTRTACNIRVGRNVEVQYRFTYTFAPPELVLVDPDGGNPLSLGAGRDPAWGADGSLYFVEGGGVRQRTSDGNVSDVAGTNGGRWPAPSPSGDYLAFVRLDPSSGYDLWVIGTAR